MNGYKSHDKGCAYHYESTKGWWHDPNKYSSGERCKKCGGTIDYYPDNRNLLVRKKEAEDRVNRKLIILSVVCICFAALWFFV